MRLWGGVGGVFVVVAIVIWYIGMKFYICIQVFIFCGKKMKWLGAFFFFLCIFIWSVHVVIEHNEKRTNQRLILISDGKSFWGRFGGGGDRPNSLFWGSDDRISPVAAIALGIGTINRKVFLFVIEVS